MGQKVFIFDSEICNGCYCCQVACKDEHCEQPWLPYADEQPETGHFWMKVDQKERGTIPKVFVSYWAHACMHCDEGPCMKAAPDAVYKREKDGLVIIDPEKAKGMKDLVDACPYGAIYYNEELDLPQKCTGCAHLLDDDWVVPRCVEACCTDALRFGDKEDFEEEIAQAEAYKGITDPKPNFFFLNMPKRFVGGEVYDEFADEVIIGAYVTLFKGEEVIATTYTDEFGDFWFRQVEPDDYKLGFSVEGYMPRVVDADTREDDNNVGSIALYAAATG